MPVKTAKAEVGLTESDKGPEPTTISCCNLRSE